jgi:hypothetical protein
VPPFASRDLMTSALSEPEPWDAVGPCGDCTDCTDKSEKPGQNDASDRDLATLAAQLRAAMGR